ncbi:hypothetical protein ACTXT7_017068 [Hymenolepis weldensis]
MISIKSLITYGAHNATKADQGNLTCARTFWNLRCATDRVLTICAKVTLLFSLFSPKMSNVSEPTVNEVAICLATNVNTSSPDELAESTDQVQEHSDRSCVHAVGTPTPSHVTAQQPDVLTKLHKSINCS